MCSEIKNTATSERKKDLNPTSPPVLVPAYVALIGFCHWR
jgi:hypothetical protein